MKNIDRKGQIAIRPGNQYAEPSVVYVAGRNHMNMLICERLNTSETLFSNPDGSDLLDLDFQVLKRLLAEWKVENAERRLASAKKDLAELLG